MDSIKIGSLDITLRDSAASIHVIWLGEADEREPRKMLLPFLEQVARRAMQEHKSVILDFSDLQFMNSACIGLVVAFLKALNGRNVQVEVRYNTAHDWQTLSMKCTRTIFARSESIAILG